MLKLSHYPYLVVFDNSAEVEYSYKSLASCVFYSSATTLV